jgi:O-antigen/teichoic acid export membrane protein
MDVAAAVLPTRRGLVRNTLVNVAGGAIPPLVGLGVTPLFVHGLGTERYGLWALAGSVLGYFIVFDLGLGRAVTKFVSEALAQGKREEVPSLFWTALLTSLLLGLVGALAFLAAVPFVTTRLLRIPRDLVPEAQAFLMVYAAQAPLQLCQRVAGALLEASHRFDLASAVGVPARVLGMTLPLVGVGLGWPLAGIAVLSLAAGLIGFLGTLAVALRVRPEVRTGLRVSRWHLRRLLGFGGWMMGASTLAMLVAGSDRVVIGAVLSTSAVAFYAPPQSLIAQIYLLPGALYATLFPAFSALGSVDRGRVERLYASAFKLQALVMGPLAILLVVFARDGLTLWLGQEFADQGTRVLQVLAVGMFLNTLAWVPSTALQGMGRPDLVAKVFLVEAPFYLGAAVALTWHLDIVGTALAWAGRSLLDGALFSLAAWKGLGLAPTLWLRNGGTRASILLALLAVAMGAVHILFPVRWRLQEAGVAVALLALFALLAWRITLAEEERRAVLEALPLPLRSSLWTRGWL